MSIATSAGTLTDLLDLAAEHGESALRSMLLDVTRAGDRLVAVGEYGTILYSEDGASWHQASVPVQVTLTAVHFASPEKGWAVGHDAVILHSADGGETWQKQLDGRQTGDLLLVGAEQWEAELLELEGSGGMDPDELMLKQDAAMMAMDEALREQEIGPNRPFMDVWFADEHKGFAIGAFNYFFVTEDGGRTWVDGSSRLPNPEFLHLYSISAVAPETLLMVGEFGLTMRSTDAGASWEILDLGYEGTLFTVNGGAGSVWIAGLRGNVFYSPDAGDSWERLEQKTEASLLGSQVTGPAGARFVGLGGFLLDVDIAGASLTLNKASPLTLAALEGAGDGSVVLVGSAGITRLDAAGARAPVTYVGGAE
jgi:photosystem II stability/assembly factor-like uncharacterized protein